MITADHGCDPGFKGTDHTREDVPLIIAGPSIRPATLGTRSSFTCIADTVAGLLGLKASGQGDLTSEILGR